MKYPKSLKENDTILVSAISDGLTKQNKIKLLNQAVVKLKSEKLNVIEDKYVRNSKNGESASAKNRALELTKQMMSKENQAIITATGGDFALEILDYIDLSEFSKNPKWIQGQSDSTCLLYYLTTKHNVATIYASNITTLGKNYDEQISKNINVLKGISSFQKSFNYKINKNNEKEKSQWKMIEKTQLEISGRIIGGCLECLRDIIGTKYDYTHKFIKKYAYDNIIWFFDIGYMSNEDIFRSFWQMKNAGWFEYTNCILVGRLIEEKSYTNIDVETAIKRALQSLKIDVITNVDLGHTNPRLTIINGAFVNIIYKNGTASLEFEVK